MQSNYTQMHHLVYFLALALFVSCSVDQNAVNGLYSFSESVDIEVSRVSNHPISIRYLNYNHLDFSDVVLIDQCQLGDANKVHCKINSRSENLDSYFEFLTKDLLLWRFNKIYGEIDEVYLGYLNRDNDKESKELVLSTYCNQYKQIAFQIPVDYAGLVFVMQDQPENSMSFKPEGIVIQSTKSLDLKSYICNKYVLKTKQGVLITSIQENLGINIAPETVEAENWGFNSGPYHDVLASTGFEGEVMVFKVLSMIKP